MTTEPPTVLVVEDDPDFGRALCDMLHSLGYQCDVVRDGFQGLKMVVRLRPDAVLADVLLPRLNGFELTQRIKAKPELKTIPVILMSSVYRNRQQMERDMATYGADAYIAKPFGLPVVEKLLSSMVRCAPSPLRSFTPDPDPLRPASRPTIEVPDIRRVAPMPLPSSAARPAKVLEGNFPSPSFPEVLHTVYKRGLSGVLQVRWEGAWKKLYFLNGVAVAADSNSTNETLGALLLDSGKVSEDDIDRAVSLMQREQCRFGQALVNSNAISVTERHEALRDQLRERILKCFRFQRGSFRFTDDPSVAQDRMTFEEHPIRLIFDGIRQYSEVNEVAAALGEHLEEYPIKTDRFAAYVPFLRNSADGWDQMLARMSGREDVGELVSLGLVDMHDLLKGLWAMEQMGMVEFRQSPATETTPVLPSVREDRGAAPPAEGLGDEAPEVRASAERVLRDYLFLRDADPWTVLGVSRDADVRTAEVAAENKQSGYHPDALPEGLSGQVRERAKELYHQVGRSLERIRAQAEEGRSPTPMADDAAEAREALAARMARALAQGRKALKARDHGEALKSFRAAAEILPDSGEAKALAGWCLFHLTSPDLGKRISAAEDMVREAIHLQPDLADAHFYLAMILKETGRDGEAGDHFEAAVRCDPEHREARWHLQVMQFRGAQRSPEAQAQVAALWDRVIDARSPDPSADDGPATPDGDAQEGEGEAPDSGQPGGDLAEDV